MFLIGRDRLNYSSLSYVLSDYFEFCEEEGRQISFETLRKLDALKIDMGLLADRENYYFLWPFVLPFLEIYKETGER